MLGNDRKNRFQRSLSCTSAAAGIAITLGANIAHGTVLDYESNAGQPLQLGVGYSSVTNKFLSQSCLQSIAGKPITNNQAQDTRLTIKQLSSMSEFAREFNLNASISARFGLGNRVSSAVDYSRSSSFTSHKYYLLVKVDVKNTTMAIEQPRLTKSAVELLRNKPTKFAEVCGDEFVHTTTLGGQFAAVLEFQTSSEEDKSALSASLRGAFNSPTVGVEGAAKAREQISKLTQERQMTVSLIRKGGAGSIIDPTDPKQLIQYALDFPSVIQKNGYLMQAVTSSYQAALAPEDIAVDVINYQPYESYLRGLIDQHEAAITTRNDLIYALANRDQFGKMDWNLVQRKLVEHTSYLTKLEKIVANCVDTARSNALGKLPVSSSSCPQFQDPAPDLTGINLARHQCEDFAGLWLGRGSTDYKVDYEIDLRRAEGCSFRGEVRNRPIFQNIMEFNVIGKKNLATGTMTMSENTSVDRLDVSFEKLSEDKLLFKMKLPGSSKIHYPAGWQDHFELRRAPQAAPK